MQHGAGVDRLQENILKSVKRFTGVAIQVRDIAVLLACCRAEGYRCG